MKLADIMILVIYNFQEAKSLTTVHNIIILIRCLTLHTYLQNTPDLYVFV